MSFKSIVDQIEAENFVGEACTLNNFVTWSGLKEFLFSLERVEVEELRAEPVDTNLEIYNEISHLLRQLETVKNKVPRNEESRLAALVYTDVQKVQAEWFAWFVAK